MFYFQIVLLTFEDSNILVELPDFKAQHIDFNIADQFIFDSLNFLLQASICQLLLADG